MLYVLSLTVPANTPEDNPAKADIEIQEKIISLFSLHLPPGCAGLVKARVKYGPKVFWPCPEDAWITGDSETITFSEHFELPETPCRLTLEACSPGTSYEHTIILRLGTLPLAAAKPWEPISRFVETFRRLLGV